MAHGRVADHPTWLLPWRLVLLASLAPFVTTLLGVVSTRRFVWLDFSMAPVLSAAILISARWPRYALVLGLPVLASPLWGDNSGNNFVVLIVLIPLVIASAQLRTAIAAAAVLVLWTIIRAVVTALRDQMVASTAAMLAALSLVLGLLMQGLARSWRESEIELDGLERRVRRVRRSQRRELAREMHGGVAHQIKLIAHTAQSRLDGDDAQVAEALAQVEERARSALAELRMLLSVLRDGNPAAREAAGQHLSGRDLPTEVVAKVSEHLRSAGHPVEVKVDAGVDRLPPALRRAVVRVMQEGSANILTHAPAGSTCWLSIEVGARRLTVLVENLVDTAPAADVVHATSGWGLVGLRERVQQLGGSFSARQVHQRWVVRADLPLTPEVSTGSGKVILT